MRLIYFCLLILLCWPLTACDEPNQQQTVEQVQDASVAVAGRDATVVNGNQVIEQQFVVQSTQELIEQLARKQNQSLSLFQKWVLALGIIFLFILVSGPSLWFIFSLFHNQKARATFIDSLRTGLSEQQPYKRSVTLLLNGITKVYGSIDDPLRGFNISLIIAYIYPILLFIFAYSFTGGTNLFSGRAVFPEHSDYAIAYFPGFLLFGGIFYLAVAKGEVMDEWARLKLTQYLALPERTVKEIWQIIIAITIGCIFYFFLSPDDIAGAGGVFGLTYGYLNGGTTSFLIATGALACAVVGASADIGISISVILAVIFAGALAGSMSLGHSTTLAFTFSGVLAVTSTCAVAYMVISFDHHNYAILLLFFYLILPLLNALLDWISWWVSRYFLAKTLQTNNPWYMGFCVKRLQKYQ